MLRRSHTFLNECFSYLCIAASFVLAVVAALVPPSEALDDTGTFYIAIKDGRWADPSTWSPAGIPGDGDTALVQHSVTVDTPQVIGRHDSGSTALTIFNGASLTITTTGWLRLHGNVIQNNTSLVSGEGSGRITFDSTPLLPPSTILTWQISNGYIGDMKNQAWLKLVGTPQHRFRVDSALGGGAGRFVHGGNAGGGALEASYTDFFHIGDATHLALAPAVVWVNSKMLSLSFCRFYKSGEVSPTSHINDNARTTLGYQTGFTIDNCQFIHSASSTPFTAQTSTATGFDGWAITNSDFDGSVLLSNLFTLSGNRYRGPWKLSNVSQSASPAPYPALTYSLSGPSALTKGTPATYTVSLDAQTTAEALVIVPSDNGAGGAFSPASVTLSTGQPNGTFTYTPNTLGHREISTTNSLRLVDPDPVAATVTAQAMTYTLQPPTPATALVAHASDPITVALVPNTTVGQQLSVTLGDGGAGGTFSPATVVLSNAAPVALIRYTPAREGSVTISATNSSGLADPAPVVLAATRTAITNYSISGPDRGDLTLPATFKVTLGDGAISGTVRIVPHGPSADAEFNPSSLELTNSIRAGTFTYTPKLWGIRSITVTNDATLIDPPAVQFLGMIQQGFTPLTKFEEQQVKTPAFGGLSPLAADSDWFNEFKRDVSNDPTDPHSDEMLARMRQAGGRLNPLVSGPWTPDTWGWYSMTFQVVNGSISPLTIPGTWSYNPSSTGPYFLPPPPVIHESSLGKDYATSVWNDGADHHLLIYERSETSGGFRALWEYYQPWVTRDTNNRITAVNGASWRRFDLERGETPPPDKTSTDAAGMLIAPLVALYQEVASGSVNHALRWEASNADISPTHKWPARTNAYPWNPNTGMPYGARIRLSAAWWAANADTVLGTGTHARIIGEALRRYGLILSDGTVGSNVEMPFISDLRWDKDLYSRLSAIPVTAFEVVKTPPLLQIDGPKALQVGETGTWRMTVMPPESPVGQGTVVRVFDGAGNVVQSNFATVDSAHRSVVVSRSFNTAGDYIIRPYAEWNTGFGRYHVTVGTSPVPPSAYFIYAAPTGNVSNALTVTVSTDHPFTGAVTITPSGCGLSSPLTIQFNAETLKSVTLTPTQGGVLTLTGTNSAGLTNPDPSRSKIWAPATTYTLTGPRTAVKGQVSDTYAVTPNGVVNGTVTLSDGGAGGVFSPPTLAWTGGLDPKTFVYTPSQLGTVRITTANSAGLPPPAAIDVVVLDRWASSYTLTGPSVASAGHPSDAFTITPNGPLLGSVVPSDGSGGIFSPPRLTWSGSSEPKTFTYTAASAGSKRVSTTSIPQINNPLPLAVNVLSAPPPSAPGNLRVADPDE